MKFSSVLLSAVLANLVASAPIKTVVVTAFTTVLVDSKGNTQYEAAEQTAATSTAAAAIEETTVAEATPVAKAAETTSSSGNLLDSFKSWLNPAETTTTSSSSSVATVAPTTSEIAETTTAATTTAAAETSTTSSSEATGSVQSGEGTYYSTGLGSCGVTSKDTDYIIAVSHEMYDKYTVGGNPNNNSLCGKKIRAFYNGNSVDVTVVDRCEGCAYNDLDFSPSAFDQLASQSLGRIDITWQWLD
ncbi:predicted protein [Candida tropicalis MYA-3404]|uniref:RlpA-like protein double-psi beta-barrel domain-containing protein n=1 Tax=Candida tropicalis (strain ATCC MYA-3404 / T1) TaxID=294747 RepID=C5M1V7_CANTT|nr:predicted protein [Candida tropicalis MYA-3404]EER35307.1 predicted protein [Candida tropicalis MYA-3404]KAG4409411.1 hypothetical protein JTP64_000049 [Candida tropicalis]MCP8718324.1 RlpA-like double-psi beta-barrel domain-containing protein [Asgard group archaeon]